MSSNFETTYEAKDKQAATDAENAPLKSPRGEPAGVDVNKFLETSLRVRLPMMTKEGDFAVPARQKKPKGSSKKSTSDIENQARNDCKTKGQELYGQAKEHALDAKKDCLPEGFAIPKTLPSRDKAIGIAKKYAVDFATNGLYAGVAIILAVVGGSAAAATGTVQTAASGADGAAADATAAASSAHNKLLGYWMVIMGAVSGIIVIVKNVRFIVKTMFEVIDVIKDKINAAIDVLQEELEVETAEMMEDAFEDAATGVMGDMAKKAAQKTILGQLSKGIDKAQKTIDPQGMLPWPAGTQLRLSACLAAPCIVVVVVSAIQGIASSAQGRRLVSLDFADERRLGLADSASQLRPMITNLVVNMLIAFLSSNPVVRFIANTVIRKIQKSTNSFVLSAAKANIPGGVESLQQTLDVVADPSSADPMKSMRACSMQSCSVS